ncbi:hypothetical protein Y1Q_0016830 [Alligator mississippiensis]|uniref:Uncharacterized protein n=1 Tax=Alligator mississippiensis TaxID=8496 RepID=A0A151P6M3_ALLMI|nr:hypothetical protein Y1Q_0016830 [Alligator mississippiensis]
MYTGKGEALAYATANGYNFCCNSQSRRATASARVAKIGNRNRKVLYKWTGIRMPILSPPPAEGPRAGKCLRELMLAVMLKMG